MVSHADVYTFEAAGVFDGEALAAAGIEVYIEVLKEVHRFQR